MKIYTEVIFQYDENSGEMVEVSSESYEHKGEVALCSWASPELLHWRGTGQRAPQVTPSMTRPFFGGKAVPGIAPRYHMPVSTGIGFSNWAGEEMIDPYTEEAIDPYDVFGQPAQEVHTPRHSSDYGMNWYEGWYNPTRAAMLEAPARNILGIGPQAGAETAPTLTQDFIDLGGPPEFITASEAGIPEELLAAVPGVGTYTAEAGYEQSLIPGKFKSEIELAGGGYKAAETAYQTALEDIETEELSIEESKELALADIGRERIREQRGIIPEQEKAAAIQATSGMAYSAPAERALTDVQAGQIEGKQDFKAEEAKVSRTYEQSLADIESAKEETEQTWAGEEAGYAADLGRILGSAATEAQELGNVASGLLSRHHQYGSELVDIGTQGGYMADVMSYPQYTGAPYVNYPIWQEQIGEHAYGPQLLQNIGGEAEQYATMLSEAAANIYGGTNQV